MMANVAPTGGAMSATHMDSDDNVRTDASRGFQQNHHKTADTNCSDDPINNSHNDERRIRSHRSKLRRDGSQNTKKQTGGGDGGYGKRVRNSYLKIVMDDESVDLMFDMAQRIRQVIRERFPDVPKDEQEEGTSKDGKEMSDVDQNHDDRQPLKKRKPPRPLTFKPRSRNSLHMTFFFGGTTICEIPPEELVEWHDQVMDRLRQASKSMSDNKSGPTESSRYTLQFRELCLFPPQRHTLIVAIFDGSPELHKLHDDLRDIAKDSNSDGLKEVVKRSKERWTAHVTLGDLYGGGRGEAKQEQLNELAKMLQDGIGLEVLEGKEGMMHPSDFTAKVKGIAMGGPVPPQVILDWDYFF